MERIHLQSEDTINVDLIPESGKFPEEGAWQLPLQIFLPGESHGQKES